MTKIVKLTIDGQPVEVPVGTTIFNAAKTLRMEIPHFCYHPKLSIAGNCRLCQVEVEGVPKPVISCRELVCDGMVVRVNAESAKQVRKDVLEFILINHPLDCPVCDQSGECKLQDQYFNHSLQASKMMFPKVEKPKAKRIGPHVYLDDERCVLCTRCIRFCDEIVGSHELMLRERGDHSTIDVFPGKELGNKYSLCTADICPVGALTSADFRFQKRVWFLSSTPSICTGCATGCNIQIDHADRLIYRYRPRDNEPVNQCWLCDDGRMTYKRINDGRTLFPQIREDGTLCRATWSEALEKCRTLLEGIAPQKVVGLLSATMSLEENMAFARVFADALKVGTIAWSGRVADPAFADKILRDADQNPNAQGVQLMAKPFAKTSAEAFIALGELAPEHRAAIQQQQPKAWIAVCDRLQDGEGVHVVLPRASHAEHDGSFINRQGRLQRFWKAFEPHAESLPAWSIAGKWAKSIGSDLACESAERVFEAEKQHYEKLKTIAYRAIPTEGLLL